jgi:serpin B
MMKKISTFLLLIVLMLSLLGCTQVTSDDELLAEPDDALQSEDELQEESDDVQQSEELAATPLNMELLQSDKTRITSPVADESEILALVDGNSTFALELYQMLREEDGNLIFSPYSISIALAMTYAGAHGQTAEEMANTLRFNLEQGRLHPAFNSLDLELTSRGEGVEGFSLNIANAIWVRKGFEFLAEYLDLLAENYGAGLMALDFLNEPEESRDTINQWASDQTEGKISNVISKDFINEYTRFILTSAIYFNVNWDKQFKEEYTEDGPFYLLDGSEETVPMMWQRESFRYAEGDGYQMVELPYVGRELSMVILLPEEGQFEAFEESLDIQRMEEINAGVRYKVDMYLTMPKFCFEYVFGISKALQEMGMPIAFTENADFSGMTGSQDISLYGITQSAFISVDETGTEAAAVTAVGGEEEEPPEPIEVTIDHPFIFLIRDVETGTILFIGRVLDPVASDAS